MSQRESLHRLVDTLSEEEAARWLTKILTDRRGASEGYLARLEGESDEDFWQRIAPKSGQAAPGGNRPIWEVIREIMADVPDEEFRNWPSSDDVDRIVYGQADPQ